MSVIEHVTSLEQLVTIEDMSFEERGERLADLMFENVKLRKLCSDIWRCARLLDANKHIDGMRISDKFREECERAFAELGIEVNR